MTTLSLADIKAKTEELASLIDATTDLLPTYGYSRDFAYPHIEVDSNGLLHYVIVERGQELERKTTSDLDELLYWIFSDVTFSMANQHELKNRVADKDNRRILFAKQEELLGKLIINWQQKEREEHQRILLKYPFDDLGGLRTTYCRQLRNKGLEKQILRGWLMRNIPKTDRRC